MRLTLLIIAALALAFQGFSQSEDEEVQVVQFSGVVLNADSLSPIPFTTVFRERDNRGTMTDYRGFFTLPAKVGDTIRFSSIGYNVITFAIPDTVESSRFTSIQMMSRDTVMLPESYVYPWPTKSQFKKEFLALDLPDDARERARKNLEDIALYDRMLNMEMDGTENYRLAMQQKAIQFSNNGMARGTTNLMNPIAWAAFIKALQEGDFKKK